MPQICCSSRICACCVSSQYLGDCRAFWVCLPVFASLTLFLAALNMLPHDGACACKRRAIICPTFSSCSTLTVCKACALCLQQHCMSGDLHRGTHRTAAPRAGFGEALLQAAHKGVHIGSYSMQASALLRAAPRSYVPALPAPPRRARNSAKHCSRRCTKASTSARVVPSAAAKVR